MLDNSSYSDSYYMEQALALAQKAYDIHEVPVGAVVVDAAGIIIGTGFNQVEKYKLQTAHAEIEAITNACKNVGDWRLNGATLFVTLQPCMMCFGLIRLSRISRVVYGAQSPLFGYALDKEGDAQLYNKDITIVGGLLAHEAATLLKKFFKQKRCTGE